MNSIFSPSSVHLPSPRWHCTPCLQVQAQNFCQEFHHRRGLQLALSFPVISQISLRAQKFSVGATVPPNEGAVSVINFEDFVEKDWSFLDSDDLMSRDDCNKNIDRIISAGRIEETSKVLVSIGSEGFVDRLVDSSPCNLLLIVHDSLLLLACIKEKYDKVKCWQGELPHAPEKWAPIDVVFLYFLPALPFKLDQIFGALAKRCSPGNFSAAILWAGIYLRLHRFLLEQQPPLTVSFLKVEFFARDLFVYKKKEKMRTEIGFSLFIWSYAQLNYSTH